MNSPIPSILVVEDERLIARSVETQLRAIGYTVAGSARSGEDAIRLADELRPDLILMDINLGAGIDGIKAADLIHARHLIPIVYLTAHSDEGTLQRAKLTEPHGYVLKPFEEVDLKIAIEIGLYKGRSDRRVRENEHWLAATLGSIGDGVIATDGQGRVRFRNTLSEYLTGWPLSDASGKDVTEVFHIVGERSRELVPNPVFDALENGRPTDLPAGTILIAHDGVERPIDDSAAPIRDVNGNVCGAVLVFRDITERKRLEEHLRQAAKMEAVGRLAGGIAHDFNNIMTIITGYSQLLIGDGNLTAAERDQYLALIHDAGQRAASLTQQILAFSRKQVLVPTILNLNNCVRDVGRIAEHLLGANIKVVLEMDPELGHVKADANQIGQVLLNLAVNARDAMPGGGRLIICTGNSVLDESVTRDHPDVSPGNYVMLSVSDTGMGIAAEVLPHIFEPFYTTKGVGKGTGLGLATVHGIIKQSGGHAAVESTVGQGTTFRIYLPRIVVQAPPRPASDTGTIQRGTETILVVEDEAAVRTMLILIFRQLGYKVLEASDGMKGVETCTNYKEPIDLLLTDLVMPRMGGRELAAAVTGARPETKVLFISGYTEDELVHHGVMSSTAEFIHKPFTLETLTRKVREVLDRQRQAGAE